MWGLTAQIRDLEGQLRESVRERCGLQDAIGSLAKRLADAESTRDACQAANTSLVLENRALNARVAELTRILEATTMPEVGG